MTEFYYNAYQGEQLILEPEADNVEQAIKELQEWFEEKNAESQNDEKDEYEIVEFAHATGEATGKEWIIEVEYTYEPSLYEQHNTFQGGI